MEAHVRKLSALCIRVYSYKTKMFHWPNHSLQSPFTSQFTNGAPSGMPPCSQGPLWGPAPTRAALDPTCHPSRPSSLCKLLTRRLELLQARVSHPRPYMEGRHVSRTVSRVRTLGILFRV